MKKNFLLMIGLLLSSVTAFADGWISPVGGEAFTTEGQHYLYNVEYDGFYCGDNAWGTRASVSRGEFFEPKAKGILYVLLGEGAEPGLIKLGETSPDGLDGVWMDGNRDGYDKFFLTQTADGSKTFTIGCTKFPNTFLTWGGSEGNTALNFTTSSVGGTWMLVSEEEYNEVINGEKKEAYQAYIASKKLKAAIASVEEEYPLFDLSDAKAVYNNTESTKEQLEAAITKISADLEAWKKSQIDWSSASASNPINLTQLLVNPDFADNNGTGWKGTSFAFQSYADAEFFNIKYDAYQTITDLHPGVYGLKAQAYYRAGDAGPAWTNFKANKENNAMLYATDITEAKDGETFTSPIMSVYKGIKPNNSLGGSELKATENGYDYFIPNNMATAKTYFDHEDGYYNDNKVVFQVTENCAQVGVKKENGVANDWSIFNKFALEYYGNGADAYQMWMDNILSNYEEFVIGDDALVTKSVAEAYNTALTTKNTAATYNDVVENKKAIDEAKKAIDENLAEWNDFKAKYDDAVKVGANEDLDLENPIIIELGSLCGENALDALKQIVMLTAYTDYFKDVLGEFTVPTAVFLDGNPENNEDPDNIDPRQFTGEELKTLAEALHKLANEALEAALKPGTDVSQYIKDAKFDLADMDYKTAKWGAWQHEQSGSVNNFRIGAKCCEAWNVTNFDVFQTIEGLPEGVYEIRMSGFYRADRGDNAWNKYFEENGQPKANPTRLDVAVYLNQSRADMKNVFDEQILADDPIWSYTENPVIYKDKMGDEVDGQPTAKYAYADDMPSAAAAFGAGKYQSAARGLIKKGDIARIGVKGHVAGDNWCIFDNFALTYLGYDKDVIKEEIEKMLPKLAVGEEETVATDVLANMNAVKGTAESAPAEATGADLFKILADMTSVLEEVDNSKSTFKTIADKFAEIEGFIADAGEEEEAAAKYLNYLEVVAFYGNNQDFSALTQEEAEQLIKDADEIIAKMAYPNYENASDKNPVDFTKFIVNPSFETRNLAGWTNDGTIAMGDHTNKAFSLVVGDIFAESYHKDGTLNVHQVVKDLPAGYYVVSANINSQNIEGSTLFANDQKVETATDTNGDTYYVVVELTEPGEIDLGVNSPITGSTWYCVDDFHLQYTGSEYPSSLLPTEAIKVEGNKVIKVAGIFSVNGMRQNSLKKGLNIIRRADGTVVKVLK